MSRRMTSAKAARRMGLLVWAPAWAVEARVDGELRRWHRVTLTFDGAATSEAAAVNPFGDFRLTVTFTHAGSGKKATVPGYYAADGNAGMTGAAAGNKWRAHFAPTET